MLPPHKAAIRHTREILEISSQKGKVSAGRMDEF